MVSDMIWSSFSISQITNSSSTVFSIQFFVIEGGVRQKLKFYYFYHHNIDNFNHNRASNANVLYFFRLEIRLVPSFYDVKSLCAFLLVQWKNALSPPPLYLPSTTGSKHISIPNKFVFPVRELGVASKFLRLLLLRRAPLQKHP